MPVKKKAAKTTAKKVAKKSPKQINKSIKRGSRGEVKSILDLPGRKRPGVRQIEAAVKAKAIKVQPKVLKRKHGRFELTLGTHKLDEVAGVVKGFRQKYKEDFGTLFKDKDGNVLARTHVARGTRSTIPEQLAVKAISKYAKGFDEVEVIISVKPHKPKTGAKKTTKESRKVLREKLKKGKTVTTKKATKKATSTKKTEQPKAPKFTLEANQTYTKPKGEFTVVGYHGDRPVYLKKGAKLGIIE